MSIPFQSIEYNQLPSVEDDDDSAVLPPTVVVTSKGSEQYGCWNHINNLDKFFSEVYEYHRKRGFACLILNDIFKLIQYVFVVLFATFLVVCVDYKTLFEDPNPSFTDVIVWDQLNKISFGLVLCLIVALIFWLVRLVHVIHHGYKAMIMRRFYLQVLRIRDCDLQSMQWKDVQKKLIEMQEVHRLCIHMKDLTELDIHNRILRRKNYLISMQNKGIISCFYAIPIIGKRTFFTEGLKFNLALILFNGPGAPFSSSWKLRSEYKDSSQRIILADKLSKRIFTLGIINMALCPFIFIYQVLHSFFTYAELIKRSPDVFGARRWSHYGRLYLRHFNELEHEFDNRLNNAYIPASKYMNVFASPLVTILARNIAFFAGAVLAVLLGLSFYDHDVLTADHVISIMAILGIGIKICASFIPDEHMVFCPELLMKQVLMNIHYIPGSWKGKAHSAEVRNEFSQLFQYKFVHLLEELLSPLLTPFILCFSLPHKSQQIVDFFRNFTVDVSGLGDVCSFAQMDIHKHGEQKWSDVPRDNVEHAENGKTELSLLHFSVRNPEWKPSMAEQHFIETIKEQVTEYPSYIPPSSLAPGYCSSTGDFTNFIGLQSPIEPAMMTSLEEDILLTKSVMFFHEARRHAPDS